MNRRPTRPSEAAGRRNIATAAALVVLFGAGGMALAASHATQAAQATQDTQTTRAARSVPRTQPSGVTQASSAGATYVPQVTAPTYHVTTHTS
ncbi:MAG: hypothetical protein U0Y82_02840 [Thermoleophilia bacterium]